MDMKERVAAHELVRETKRLLEATQEAVVRAAQDVMAAERSRKCMLHRPTAAQYRAAVERLESLKALLDKKRADYQIALELQATRYW
jgi:isochorismate synthase EntC